ncbi:GntP family permease [Croceivirga lutea]|uniref:GntP family permease n=1 Tax=Croceivirga lutea TaxID=1775167 RepID=UPI00163B1980|nr:GntP family permease [Croceivirga lutea]
MEFIVLILVVIFIVLATIKFKVHPVISLILAAIFSGFGLGLQPLEITEAITSGFGSTLSGIGLVIAFGTIIGIYLEKTGGTKVMADSILKLIGLNRSALALNLAGFVISIPVYCDSGFVILSSLNKALSKKTGAPYLLFAIALATGLYSAHVFVPPTPGPLAAASILGADLGMVLILGLVVALPVSVAGYFWAKLVSKKITSDLKEEENKATIEVIAPKVSVLQAFLPIVIPVVLIALKSFADYPSKPLGEAVLFKIIAFIGSPVIALLIGVFFAFFAARTSKENKEPWMVDALKQAGLIILITGAGGAFGQVIRSFDFASALNLSSATGFGGLLVCFVIAAILKTAQGSSTVAIITTSAIIAPLLGVFGLEEINQKALAVLAIGAGAMTVSHVNDSYFWVVSQFSGLHLKNALKGHTLATLIQGITGIIIILLLHLVV